MTAHTLPDGETVILVVHQALYMGRKHSGSLLCPNQLRCNGVRVDDCPKHLGLGLNTRHSIISKEDDLEIPLEMDGTISYFETHVPTKAEINKCRHIVLTSPEEWDPKSDDFGRNERLTAELDTGDRDDGSDRYINAFASGNDLEKSSVE